MSWRDRILKWGAAEDVAIQEAIPRLLDSEEFQVAMQREWSRGERIGLPLSMVTIAVPLNGDDRLSKHERDELMELAALWGRRIRCTDIIGWYEGSKIAVLLPHTSDEAAWNLIDDIQSQMGGLSGNGSIQRHFRYNVYTYPIEE